MSYVGVRARLLTALLLVFGIFAALPGQARAYDRKVSLDIFGGWGLATGLALPDHGPAGGLGVGIGFDDTWGLGIYGDWAVHPRFTDAGDPLHVGRFGVEGLYYLDIFEIVPFFGVGVDVLTTFDGTNTGADFALHLRASVDYLASRDIAIGFDIRPYVLFTALSTNPVYLTFQIRLSILLDY